MKIKLGSALLALAGRRPVRVAATPARAASWSRPTGSDRRGDAGVEATHTLTLAGVGRRPRGDRGDRRDVADLARTSEPAGRRASSPTRSTGCSTQVGSRIAARVADGLPWAPAAGSRSRARRRARRPRPSWTTRSSWGPTSAPSTRVRAPCGRTAAVALPRPGAAAARRRSAYVYRPYSNTAEPHVDVARTLSRRARSRRPALRGARCAGGLRRRLGRRRARR